MNHERVVSSKEILKYLDNDSDSDVSEEEYGLFNDDVEVDIIKAVDEENEVHRQSSDNEPFQDTEEFIMEASIDSGLFYSKNGDEIWSSVPISMPQEKRSRKDVLKKEQGPSRFALKNCEDEASCFMLFMKQNLIETICKWTNKEGRATYQDWTNVDIVEFKKFLAVLILTGVYKSNNEDINQLWSMNDGRRIFNNIMARDRFLAILRFLRFDDASVSRTYRSPDKLAPIREVFETWDSYLREAYVPGWCMTVGEQLITFRGRCPFKQYIPSIPGKYGIKIWAICDSETSYCWKLEVYLGKEGETRTGHFGESVVKRLVVDLEKSGRNITCDNFFTSLNLAVDLFSKDLTMVGTISQNKGELPLEFVTAKRQVYSTLFGFQSNVMIASYVPKKNKVITLMSTLHDQPSISCKEKNKPEIILTYNSTKGGLVTMNQKLQSYSVKRKTNRWPLVLFFNMVDISVMNAFIIWMMLEPRNEKNRRPFIIQLGKQLAGVNIGAAREATKLSTTPVPVTAAKRKRCAFCVIKKDRKSQMTCCKCAKPVCSEHSAIICQNCL